MASKSKSTAPFVPELDGAGRVFCPVDQKALKRINTNPSSDHPRAGAQGRAGEKG